MTTTNARYFCPKCQSTDLHVAIKTMAKLIQDDDGNLQTDVDPVEHWLWHDASLMLCDRCKHKSPARHFDSYAI